jgi:hypothetical protein
MLVTEDGSDGMPTLVSGNIAPRYTPADFLPEPGAEGIAKVYKAAGSPKQVFGFATNIAGWNAFQQTPGEFSTATDAKYNKCQDEKRYVNAFAPLLKTAGMPNHAIVDTGRNAVTGLRLAWGDWCNVIGAGFGVRPTTTTNDALVDAFVWGKPGGESDGVSDPDADRYDSFCGHEDGKLSFKIQCCSNLILHSVQAISTSRSMEPGLLRAAPCQRQPTILNQSITGTYKINTTHQDTNRGYC